MEDIPEDYSQLLNLYKTSKKELEVTNQNLYDCKRQLKTALALEKEYQEEIRALQTNENEYARKYEKKLESAKETITTLRAKDELYEKDISEKNSEILSLKQELASIVKVAETTNTKENETLIMQELDELKDQNLLLLQDLKELTTINDELKVDQKSFQDKITDLQEELVNMKETFDCKKVQLDEANSLIQTLKDNFLCLQAELDVVKNKPLDQETKGNSLFAEVNDRRVELQHNMNLMKSKYIEMKRDNTAYIEQISALRRQNQILIAESLEERKEREEEQEYLEVERQVNIKALKEIIESYKKQLKEKEELLHKQPEISAINSWVVMKDEEIEDLRGKFAMKSMNLNVVAHDLVHAKREIRKLKLDILKMENQLEDMKTELEEMKNENKSLKEKIQEKKPEVEKVEHKSILKGSRKPTVLIDLTNDKESERKLTFSGETVEPKTTDLSEMKKRSRCKFIPVTHVPPKV